MADGVPHLRAGEGPGERHIRVFEAWLREHPALGDQRMTNRTINEAITWWNASAPGHPEKRADA